MRSWLAAFFTRDVRLRDLSRIRLPARRRRAAPRAAQTSTFEATRLADPMSGFDADDALDVNEQPIDTLPAELRMELESTRESGWATANAKHNAGPAPPNAN